jgi:glycosyltransferase involved in cell wall biosynthesis
MQNKKVFYVVSLVHKSLAFEWIATSLRKSSDLTFILLNPDDSEFQQFLFAKNVRVIRINFSGKRDILKTFFRLCLIFAREKPDVVHTHLVDATWMGITAAWFTRIPMRIYTRHNSTLHHVYYPSAVKYDRFVNKLATQIISISQATDFVLLNMENVPVKKLRKIEHGFHLELFSDPKTEKVKLMGDKWTIRTQGPCIGVIARHIEWKGIQYIIPAFQQFLGLYPDAQLVMANAAGPYHKKITEMLKDIPSRNYVQIPFEEDIASLYPLFHIYVHTPVDSTCEAFGQTYVEALAAGIPSIFTLSGIAAEFIEHKQSAWVVDFENTDQILAGMKQLWTNELLRRQLIENGRNKVFSKFTFEPMMDALNKLYNE